MHLRDAAVQLGAHAITHVRFHESATEEASDMGRLTAQLVQFKECSGPENSFVPGKPLDTLTPFKHYDKHAFPEGILGHRQDFEIMVERA